MDNPDSRRNFVFRSDSTKLLRRLQLLTNAAELSPSAITIDNTRKEIIIPLSRKEYARKRLFFGLGEAYRRVSSTVIPAELVIRDFLEYELTNVLRLESVTLLFGVKVEDLSVYLCCVEETAGTPAFQLSVKLRSYDIEVRDIE